MQELLKPLNPLEKPGSAPLGEPTACGCEPEAAKPALPLSRYVPKGLAILAAYVGLYFGLTPASRFFVHDILGLQRGKPLGEALAFFFYDVPKVLALLVAVVFLVGILRSFFTPERTRVLLAGKRTGIGCALAAGLGVLTPFCSCSAVPLFIGFVSAGVPLGVTFAFLIASPMINEVALALLFDAFGWKVAGAYLVTGLGVAISSGLVLGALDLDHLMEDWVRLIRAEADSGESPRLTWGDRIEFGIGAVRDIVKKTWPYVVAGIAVGAGVHGWVPEDALAGIMGADAWWSVPLAVAVGIPMYASAAGVVPVVQALLAKGAALGTVLAFMMSVIALSLPEMLILRRVLKPKLIGVFVGVVGFGIMLVGFLFNAVF